MWMDGMEWSCMDDVGEKWWVSPCLCNCCNFLNCTHAFRRWRNMSSSSTLADQHCATKQRSGSSGRRRGNCVSCSGGGLRRRKQRRAARGRKEAIAAARTAAMILTAHEGGGGLPPPPPPLATGDTTPPTSAEAAWPTRLRGASLLDTLSPAADGRGFNQP